MKDTDKNESNGEETKESTSESQDKAVDDDNGADKPENETVSE